MSLFTIIDADCQLCRGIGMIVSLYMNDDDDISVLVMQGVKDCPLCEGDGMKRIVHYVS